MFVDSLSKLRALESHSQDFKIEREDGSCGCSMTLKVLSGYTSPPKNQTSLVKDA